MTAGGHATDGYGYLTYDQFDRFRHAINVSLTTVRWLRVAGYIRTGEEDVRVHVSTDRPLGVPPTWIAAEEISRLLQELNQWTELEDAANDEFGAWIAWEFTREVETARAKWPYEDRPHKVRHMRCQACGALTLRYLPPRAAEDRILVRCSDRLCGAVMDEDMFAFAAKLIESENNARRLGNSAGSDGKVQAGSGDDLPVGERGPDSDYASDEVAVA